MYGDPLNDALQALYSGLESLKPEDSFNIIAFDHETALFSSQMERANSASILRAREWATEKCKARGGTDILSPLQQVRPRRDCLLVITYSVEDFAPYIWFYIFFGSSAFVLDFLGAHA